MKTIIKGDTDYGDIELEVTDEGLDNPNIVTLSIWDKGSNFRGGIDVPIEDLYAAVVGFRRKQESAKLETDSRP